MRTLEEVSLLLGVVMGAATWVAIFLLLGGTLSSRYPFMPQTGGTLVRSFAAGIVAVAVFAVTATMGRGR